VCRDETKKKRGGGKRELDRHQSFRKGDRGKKELIIFLNASVPLPSIQKKKLKGGGFYIIERKENDANKHAWQN